MNMDATLAIILKAQDQMSAIFKQATDSAKGLEASNKAVGVALEGASQSADDMAQSTEGAAVSNAALRAILERVAESSGQTAASLKKLESGLEKTEEKGKDAKKSGESFATTLNSLISVGKTAGEALSAAFQMASESVSKAAAEGDRGSQALMGVFASVRQSIDNVVNGLAKTLLPILTPIALAIEDVSKSLTRMISKESGVKKFLLAMLDGAIMFTGAAGTAVQAIQMFSGESVKAWDIVTKVVTFAINEITLGMSDYISKAKNFFSAVQAVVNAFDPKKLKAGFLDIATGTTAYADAANASAEASRNAFQKLSEGLAALREEFASGKAAHEDYFASLSEAGKKAVEDQQKMNDEVSASLGDLSADLAGIVDGMIAKDQEYLDAADEAAQHAEELSQKKAEDLRALAEMRAKDTDEAVAAIDLLGLSEEAAAQRKIELYAMLAEASKANADIQRAAQTKMVQEPLKPADMMASKWKQTSSSSASAFGAMIDTMLKGGTTLKDKLKTIFSQVSDMVLANLQKQQDAAITAAEKSVAAGEAASIREALAAQKGIIPKILSATASLGWPAGPIAAGLMIAAFNASSKKVISFFEEGGVVGGMVQGFGRKDSVINAVMPGEGVLNRSATESIGGKPVVDFINKTGQLPTQSSSGERRVYLSVDLNLRGGLLMPQQLSKEVGPLLIDTINHAVLMDGATLYATDAAI